MTDNGAATGAQTFNAGMRGAKGTPYQGGTRVPAFWRWPGGFEGGRDRTQLTAHIDIFPTLAEIAGAKPAGRIRQTGRGPLALAAVARSRRRVARPHARDPRRPLGERTSRQGQVRGVQHPQQPLLARQFEARRRKLGAVRPGGRSGRAEERHRRPSRRRARPSQRQLDKFWEEATPLLVNEDAVGPAQNPFKVLYWKQFGGGPTEKP